MTQTPSAAIVAPLLSLAWDLTVYAQDHPNASLADLEQAVLDHVRAQLPKVL